MGYRQQNLGQSWELTSQPAAQLTMIFMLDAKKDIGLQDARERIHDSTAHLACICCCRNMKC